MRYTTREKGHARPENRRAAVFVDYENLHGLLSRHLDGRSHPDEYVTEIIEALRAYLQHECRTEADLVIAYADFTELGGGGHVIQRGLYLQGAEPRFAPATLQANAAEIQLCVDAVDLLHRRPDVDAFVLVTGDRAYLPLVQQLKRHGRQALVVTLELPPSLREHAYAEGELFLDAASLLGEDARRQLAMSPAAPHRQNGTAAPGAPREHVAVTDDDALRTLEIIDEHFGQYDEVYLTPLLRKLSEVFDDDRYDPKSLISTLEGCGAVALEKRRGFPYDYTVLIVDGGHPDVSRLQSASYYDDEGYDDEDDFEGDDFDNDFDGDGYDGEAPDEPEALAEDGDDEGWDERA